MTTLASHRRIALDSNVLIYLLEGHGALAEAAAIVVDTVETEGHDGIIAAIGIAEILAGPAAAGDAAAFERMADAIRDLRLRVVAIDRRIAEDGAWLGGALGLTAADAIHLAAARAAGATAFVTNDRRLRSIPRLEVIPLDSVVG